MLRQGLLWLSKQPQGFRLVRASRLARSVASRFVAGETMDDAMAAATRLATQGFTTTLDLLGECVTSVEAARAACEQCLVLLDRMRAEGIEVNISVKLTQLGLDLDLALCGGHLERIVERASAAGGFVRIDMEGSACTDRTLGTSSSAGSMRSWPFQLRNVDCGPVKFAPHCTGQGLRNGELKPQQHAERQGQSA